MVHLAATDAMPEAAHMLDERSIQAVNAALAAKRPLLIRGEPGIGKSQCARAAARELGRALLHQVADSRTESRDLLWYFDAIERLAEAQLRGALGDDKETVKKELKSPIIFTRARFSGHSIGKTPRSKPKM